VPQFLGTHYYLTKARFAHAEVKPEWIDYVLEAPEESRPGRHSRPGDERSEHWRYVPEARHYVMVVTVADGRVHNAMFDRTYARRKRREGESP
jgi:hypothetical protein